jgi:hypothetical protein
MAKEAGTINDTGTNTGVEGGASSAAHLQSGELKDTMVRATSSSAPSAAEETDKGGEKGKPVETSAEKTPEEMQAEKDAQAEADAKAEQDRKDKEAEGQKEKEFTTRLDKHPRFQQVIKDRNAARDAQRGLEKTVTILQAQVETLTKTLGGDTRGKGRSMIMDLPDEQLRERFDADPRAVLAEVARQVRDEVTEDITEKLEKRIGASLGAIKEEDDRAQMEMYFNGFRKDHSDFDKFFDSGQIEALMDENPAHNPLSAYYELAAKEASKTDVDKLIKEAVAKAVKETKEKTIAEIRAKGGARTLGGPSSQHAPASEDENLELKDTKKGGGLLSTLTKRSLAREERRAAGG